MQKGEIIHMSEFRARQHKVPDEGERANVTDLTTARRRGRLDLYLPREERGVYNGVQIPSRDALYDESVMRIGEKTVADVTTEYQEREYPNDSIRNEALLSLQERLFIARSQYIAGNLGRSRRQPAMIELANYTWGVGREDGLPGLKGIVATKLIDMYGVQTAEQIQAALKLLDTIYENEKKRQAQIPAAPIVSRSGLTRIK